MLGIRRRLKSGRDFARHRWQTLTTGVDAKVADDDSMLIRDWPAQYFDTGKDALRNILLAMNAVGKEEFRSILDLPCGHGRVMRFMRSRFPGAKITACDLDRGGVDFCEKRFRATGVYSKPDISSVVISGKFDLIWVGSLLTHVAEWQPFLKFFSEHLENDGVLIFTTQGRYTERMLLDGVQHYFIEDIPGVLSDYSKTGFAYRDYSQTPGYGISIANPTWVIRELQRHPELKLVSFTEIGWAKHQDVVVCQKRGFPELIPWDRRRTE